MKKLFNILLFSGLSLAMLNGCKNPAEDVHIQVSTDIFKSPTVLVFKNENAAGTPLTNVNIEFIGDQAGLVRTATGGTNFKVSNGYIGVVLDRAANPTTANPVKLTVLVSAAGFAPTIQDIYLTDPKATSKYVIELKEFAKPIAGTSASVTNHGIAAGKVSSAIQLSTPLAPSVNERVYVTIPAGTSLLDKNKNVINSAQLEARVMYAGTVNGIPPTVNGGMISTNVLDQTGAKLAAGKMIIPDATTTIKLTAGSTEVKYFSNPITIELEISATQLNPETKKPYVAGEKLEMHSIDFATGAWKEEGEMTIETAASGKLVAKKQVDHLSDFLFSLRDRLSNQLPPIYQFPVIGSFTRPIFVPAYISFGSAPIADVLSGVLTVEVKRDKDDFDEEFEISVPSKGTTTVTLKKGELSKNIEYTYNFAASGAVTVSTKSFRFKTAEQKFNVTTSGAKLISAYFESQTAAPIAASGMLYYQCSGKRINSPLNADVMMVDVKTNQSSTVEIRNGAFAATLIEGNQYKIIAQIDGTSYTHTFTASKTAIELPTQAGFALSLKTTTTPNGEVSIFLSGTVTGNCK